MSAATTIPPAQTALVLSSIGGPYNLATRPVPTPGPGQVLVKIHAAGLNPIDMLMQKVGLLVQEWPAVTGTDAAGEIVKIGEGVEEGRFTVGDRVLFQGYYVANRGTYQQYALADAVRTIKIPSTMSYDQAASTPLTFHTAALVIYGHYSTSSQYVPGTPILRGMGLELPVGSGEGKYGGEPILITGGASGVGRFAIQLAKLSGFNPIITTCSASNSQYCLSAGATHTIDYKSTSYASLHNYITSEITKTPIRYIYDVISSPESQKACWDILSNEGGKMCTTLPMADSLKADMVEDGVDAKAGGKGLYGAFGNGNSPEMQDDGNVLARALEGWLSQGKIKPCRVEVLPNGLASVAENLPRFFTGGVSGFRMVLHPFETPAV